MELSQADMFQILRVAFVNPELKKVDVSANSDRKAFQFLLEGCVLVDTRNFKQDFFLVCDAEGNVLMKLTDSAFIEISHLLKKHSRLPATYVISKTDVRKEHGNSIYKKLYRLHLLKRKVK